MRTISWYQTHATISPIPSNGISVSLKISLITLTCPVMSSGPSIVWVNISRCHLTGTISVSVYGCGEAKNGEGRELACLVGMACFQKKKKKIRDTRVRGATSQLSR